MTVAAPNSPPAAALSVTPSDPVVGEEVTLDASGSSDPDGRIIFWEFDADGDGTFDIFDVADFLREFDGRAVQGSVALFDFDGSGAVDIFDVAALLREV